MILTARNAKRALVYWQEVLRLQDWDLVVKIVREVDMPTPNGQNYGEVMWSPIYRNADIYLLDPRDFSENDGARERDMENTLVHEMLHLVLRDCRIHSKDGDGKLTHAGLAEERAVDALSSTLVGLARGAAEA